MEMKKEKELFEPVMLCRPDGSLNRESVGWSRTPLHTCNLRGHWPRKKKWNYWAITTDEFVFSISLANVDYIGLEAVIVVEYQSIDDRIRDFSGGGYCYRFENTVVGNVPVSDGVNVAADTGDIGVSAI